MAEFIPIGIIHSPYSKKSDAPIQAAFSGAEGTVEVFEEFADGLMDLEGFSHIWLIYHFDRSDGYSLTVKPYLDSEERGVFACRAPRRPNAIGMSLVELVSVEGNILQVKGPDMLDGTPLLDIKPYIPEFDDRPHPRIGWLEGKVSGAPGAKGG